MGIPITPRPGRRAVMAWGAVGVLGLAYLLAEVICWPGPPPDGACYQRIEGVRFCRSTDPGGTMTTDRQGVIVEPYQGRPRYRWRT